MNKLYNYFKNLDSESKISQAFLIGNVCFNDVKEELYKIFKDFLFKNNNKVESNPDIYLLGTDDTSVGKEDIKNLLNKLSTTSQFNSIKICIIDKCEILNDSSCNALLKTIEEPPSGVYIFLLASNIDNVLSTIVSRCQKIFISTNSSIESQNELIEISNNVINSIEMYGLKTIANNSDIYTFIEDRNSLLIILNNILNEYSNTLNRKIRNEKCDNILISNNSIENLISKISIINENINRLNNPLNKNLSIDRFIIEMWRCNK